MGMAVPSIKISGTAIFGYITKLALFCCPFFVNESKKRAGLRKRYFTRINFQLFTSLTHMGSISEYFSSLLIPYSRCLHRNFEFLKNPIF